MQQHGFSAPKTKKRLMKEHCVTAHQHRKKNADFDFHNDVKDGLWSKTQLFMVYKPLKTDRTE